MKIEEKIIQKLISKKQKVVVAESCTGGLISAQLCSIPGASNAVVGGWVVYSPEWKISKLGLDPKELKKNGIVSEETATQMAEAALFLEKNAQWAVSITGDLGPKGNHAGQVFCAIAHRGKKEHGFTQVYAWEFKPASNAATRSKLQKKAAQSVLKVFALELA